MPMHGRCVHLRSRGASAATIQSAVPSVTPSELATTTDLAIDFLADPQTGVAPEAWTPRPPYAFKISMFNVFCNSH